MSGVTVCVRAWLGLLPLYPLLEWDVCFSCQRLSVEIKRAGCQHLSGMISTICLILSVDMISYIFWSLLCCVLRLLCFLSLDGFFTIDLHLVTRIPVGQM